MAGSPTQLVIEHLTGDPAIVRDARRRLTLADCPADFRDRIACSMRHTQPGAYPAIRNARLIRTHARLGALRRALVQVAAQHAPTSIGGFPALLAWALAAVDWPEVVRCVTMVSGGSVQRSVRARRISRLVFGVAAR